MKSSCNRPKNETSGKQKAFIICKILGLDSQYKKLWKHCDFVEALEIYYKEEDHPIRLIIKEIINKHNIEVAILTVPAEAAQETAVTLEKCGIKAILNFAPVKLSLNKQIKVSNIDLAMELKTLSFFIR